MINQLKYKNDVYKIFIVIEVSLKCSFLLALLTNTDDRPYFQYQGILVGLVNKTRLDKKVEKQ